MSSRHRNLEPLDRWHATIYIYVDIESHITLLSLTIIQMHRTGVINVNPITYASYDHMFELCKNANKLHNTHTCLSNLLQNYPHCCYDYNGAG